MHFGAGELDALSQQYENDGFVKIQPFFDPQRIQEIERELADYTQNIVPTLPAGEVIWEPERLGADVGAARFANLFRMKIGHCR